MVSLKYTSSTGTSITFQQPSPSITSGYQIASPVYGLGYPNFRGVYEKVSQQAGTTLRRLGIDSRLIRFQCLVQGDTYNDWLTKRSQLHSVIKPTFGDETARPGTLEISFSNGDKRRTECFVSGITYGPNDTIKPGYSVERIAFHCPNPWLYDSSVTHETTMTESDAGFAFDDVSTDGYRGMVFPAEFGSTGILANRTITNKGNVRTWPTITATGPFTTRR